MATNWKKVDDDYVQRIYFNPNNHGKIQIQKKGGIKIVVSKKGLVSQRVSFYSIPSATKWAKQYMKVN